MRKLLLLSVFALATALPSRAQEHPKAEIFGGYSYVHLDGGLNVPGGWHASLAGNANKWLGLVGEFSGHYKSVGGVSTHLHTFTFGPRLSYRVNDAITPFGHATFGAAHTSSSIGAVSLSNNSFAMTLGGGVDVKATDHLAVRVGQFDYLLTRFASNTQNNFRYSAGVVYRF